MLVKEAVFISVLFGQRSRSGRNGISLRFKWDTELSGARYGGFRCFPPAHCSPLLSAAPVVGTSKNQGSRHLPALLWGTSAWQQRNTPVHDSLRTMVSSCRLFGLSQGGPDFAGTVSGVGTAKSSEGLSLKHVSRQRRWRLCFNHYLL